LEDLRRPWVFSLALSLAMPSARNSNLTAPSSGQPSAAAHVGR
jgi:hypothetical protein